MAEKDIIKIIQKDLWMMEILEVVRELNLPDWWIGAGFVRGKVWDHLHGYEKRTQLPDIDVIYFDTFNPSEVEIQKMKLQEKVYEELLKKKRPEINWSVKNQSRMHLFHNHKPYKNSTEALAQWVETATCIGVSMEPEGKLKLTAPRGIEDLVNLKLRPTPDHTDDLKTFNQRINKKQWLIKWPKLKIVKT